MILLNWLSLKFCTPLYTFCRRAGLSWVTMYSFPCSSFCLVLFGALSAFRVHVWIMCCFVRLSNHLWFELVIHFLSRVYGGLALRKDESLLDGIGRIESSMENNQACVFEFPLVYHSSSCQLPTRPAPTVQSNPGFYVPDCAREKWGHHFGGTLLPSWYGGGTKSVLHF